MEAGHKRQTCLWSAVRLAPPRWRLAASVSCIYYIRTAILGPCSRRRGLCLSQCCVAADGRRCNRRGRRVVVLSGATTSVATGLEAGREVKEVSTMAVFVEPGRFGLCVGIPAGQATADAGATVAVAVPAPMAGWCGRTDAGGWLA